MKKVWTPDQLPMTESECSECSKEDYSLFEIRSDIMSIIGLDIEVLNDFVDDAIIGEKNYLLSDISYETVDKFFDKETVVLQVTAKVEKM